MARRSVAMTMAWRSSKAAPAPQRRARRPLRPARTRWQGPAARTNRAAQGVVKCDCSPGRESRAAAASVTVGKIRAEAHAVAAAGFPALAVSAQQKPATRPAAGGDGIRGAGALSCSALDWLGVARPQGFLDHPKDFRWARVGIGRHIGLDQI